MRQEIKNALEKYQRLADIFDVISKSLPEGADLADYTANARTEEAEAGLQMMYRNQALFKSCISLSSSVKSVEVATESSLSVKWSDTPRGQIVVELSQWEPLVAIYIYGIPPAELIHDINTCIDTIGLIKLSDTEIAELEDQGLYNYIF